MDLSARPHKGHRRLLLFGQHITTVAFKSSSYEKLPKDVAKGLHICDRIWENVHSSHIRFCTFKGS